MESKYTKGDKVICINNTDALGWEDQNWALGLELNKVYTVKDSGITIGQVELPWVEVEGHVFSVSTDHFLKATSI